MIGAIGQINLVAVNPADRVDPPVFVIPRRIIFVACAPRDSLRASAP